MPISPEQHAAALANLYPEAREHVAIGYLFGLFGRRGAPGITMAVRALRLAIPEDEIIGVATAYVERLRSALEGSR